MSHVKFIEIIFPVIICEGWHLTHMWKVLA